MERLCELLSTLQPLEKLVSQRRAEHTHTREETERSYRSSPRLSSTSAPEKLTPCLLTMKFLSC